MALTHPSWTVDTTFSGKNIASAASVYTFTAAAAGKVQFCVKATVAGNGDYVVYLTHQWLGTGTAAVVLPKTTAAAASGETVIEFVSQEIAVKATDVVDVMIDGLAGDNSVSGAIRISADNPSVFDAAADVPAVNVTMWDSGALPQVAEKSDVSSLVSIQNDTAELASMTELAGESTYRFKTTAFRNIIGADGDTLETLSDQLDAILEDTGTTLPALISAGGAGSGLYSETITISDALSNPLDGVLVQVATDGAFVNIVRSGYTNNLGQVTLNFDAIGTYYGRAEIAGYGVSEFDIEVTA